MATKTSKTKKTAAATKTTARANTKAKPRARAASKPSITEGFDMKTALLGGGVGALVGGLATKLIFFR